MDCVEKQTKDSSWILSLLGQNYCEHVKINKALSLQRNSCCNLSPTLMYWLTIHSTLCLISIAAMLPYRLTKFYKQPRTWELSLLIEKFLESEMWNLLNFISCLLFILFRNAWGLPYFKLKTFFFIIKYHASEHKILIPDNTINAKLCWMLNNNDDNNNNNNNSNSNDHYYHYNFNYSWQILFQEVEKAKIINKNKVFR